MMVLLNIHNACFSGEMNFFLLHTLQLESCFHQSKHVRTLSYCFRPSYDELNQIASHILDKTKHRPLLGLVCGSGLGGLADVVEEADVFEYKDIPGFPVSTGESES